jgi:hypothetical protein
MKELLIILGLIVAFIVFLALLLSANPLSQFLGPENEWRFVD